MVVGGGERQARNPTGVKALNPTELVRKEEEEGATVPKFTGRCLPL